MSEALGRLSSGCRALCLVGHEGNIREVKWFRREGMVFDVAQLVL